MKIYSLLFVLILFSFPRNIKAQVTNHFLHSGAVWGQFQGFAALINGQWGLEGGTGFQSSQGDTIIDSKSYIKIGNCDSLGNPGDFGYEFIREDSIGRVWHYYSSDDSDKLLYDFNLSAGDTATVFAPWQMYNCPLIVDSVSTVMVLGNPRKAIYFDPHGGPCAGALWGGNNLAYPVIWIEGIGSNGGLFYPDGGGAIPDASLWLTCYRENGQLAFGDVCNITLAISSPASFNSSFKISPNPFTISTTITLSNSIAPLNLQLFDELGREVQVQYHATQQGSRTMVTIDRGGLKPGMYFISIASGEKREVVKMVVE